MWPENQFQAFFNFQRILSKMESEEVVIVMIWTNFDSFVNKYSKLVFGLQFSNIFLIKFFLLYYDINWSNFINRMCLLLKLFSKMYFFFYA